MDVEEIDRQLEAIDAQVKRIRTKLAKLADTKRTLEAEERKLENTRGRLRLCRLVGKSGAVKLRYRLPNGDRAAHLNDLRGTILSVKRTRALVDYGQAGATAANESGQWTVLLTNLLPSDGLQGEIVCF